MPFTAGRRLRASELGGLVDAWTAYTPVWSASTTAPVLNNGTITGAWRQVGRTVDVRIALTMGSTTTFGTGNYRLSLPVAPKSNSLLSCYCDDSSASQRWAGQARIIAELATGDNMRIAATAGTSVVTNTAPFTWAASDVLVLTGTFEIA